LRQCPQCHAEWEDEILVCPEDGTRLAFEDAPAAAAPAPTAAAAPAKPAPRPEAADDDPLIGTSVGSYQIMRLLGSGGMGAVYLAEHPVIRSRVAVKFLHPQFTANKKIVDRFFNEARAVNLIGHDNILKILDLNITADGRHYFVMELLEGRPLQALVEEEKPVPLEVAGPILIQFCEALQAAHDQRIFHRDVKPDNVYLTAHKGRKNFVKVVDFGVAKLTEPGPAASAPSQGIGTTQTGMVVGTPAYMSPEQAGGVHSKIDARSDIYSTGVMMFQMATGKLPFPSENFGEVLIGHLRLAPPRPRDLNPDIPLEYEQVILQAMAKSQDARQQSMRELESQISEVMHALRISKELPPADELPQSPEMVRLAQAPLPPPRRRKEAPRFGEAEVASPATGPLQRSGRTMATRIAAPMTAVQDIGVPRVKPKGQRNALLAAGAVALVAAVALLASALLRAGEPAQKRRSHPAPASAPAAPEEPSGPVLLSIVSDPLGADVEATWHDGTRAGRTPFDLRIARDTKVTLVFHLAGYAPYRQDVIADESQVVTALMQRDGSARPAEAPRKPAEKPRARNGKDEVIDVADQLQ